MDRLASYFGARGFVGHSTPHFVALCRAGGDDDVVLLHALNQWTLDEDLAGLLGDELGAEVLRNTDDYGCAMAAIIASVWPERPALEAWHRYSLNTLDRMRSLLSTDGQYSGRSHVQQFAAIYRCVLGYTVGRSLLDVGTSLGFLPVLAAERVPGLRAVGCDSRQEVVACASDLASSTRTDARVRFLVRNVLDPSFQVLGHFDTVVAIHLIEHLTDEQVATAMANMIGVTTHRLIVAVPYEERTQHLYGHQQRFTAERLHKLGEWCVDRLGGGDFWCEDVSGGLLVLDRSTPAPSR
jgi:SAM-dependent methyltransferase